MTVDRDPGYPTLVEGFGYAPCAPALWRADAGGGLESRDLSLRSASNDTLDAKHIRAGGHVRELDDLIAPNAPFAFLFVLGGVVDLREEGHAPVELKAFSAATRYGAGAPVHWRLSNDAEVFLMVAHRAAASRLGVASDTACSWTISHDTADAYRLGEGPRRFFKYRDLGVAGATARRIHIHVVAATGSVAGGTGWHSHTMGQIFFVLSGWADLAVDRRPWVRMGPCDAMCLSAGMTHDVPGFSDDYRVLEMCVPADYTTTDAPAPGGLDAVQKLGLD